MGCFWGLSRVQKVVWGLRLLMELNNFYFLFLSILTFDFDLILCSSFTFWGPIGLILGLEYGLATVLRSTHVAE